MRTDTEELEKEKVEEITEHDKSLILHNDDVNSFDNVINSLIDICKHNPEQASQCALIVHTKGKCDVKHGKEGTLKKMKSSLQKRGLIVTIE